MALEPVLDGPVGFNPNFVAEDKRRADHHQFRNLSTRLLEGINDARGILLILTDSAFTDTVGSQLARLAPRTTPPRRAPSLPKLS